MKSPKRQTSSKKKITPRALIARNKRIAAYISAFLLGLSVFRGDLWLFVPACVALISFQWLSTGYVICGIAMVVGLVTQQALGPVQQEIQILIWLALFASGFLLSLIKKMSDLMVSVCWFVAVFALLGGALILSKSSSLEITELRTWIETQFFPSDASPELEEVFETQKAFFVVAGFGVLSLVMGGIFLFNLMILKFLDSSLKWRWRRAAYWRRFSEWRANEWVLVPLVVGLLGLSLNYATVLEFQLQAADWILWNLSLVAVFPLALAGLSFFIWLIPRVSFILGVILLLVLFFNAYAVVIAGFGDIWFNFRKEIRDFQKRQKEKEQDDTDEL